MIWLACLEDGLFAAVSAVGFAAISRPTREMALLAGLLAALGHMCRFLLLDAHMGIASASLCAALLISLCSLLCVRRCRIPAEMFAFPALLPMIPGMYAYKAILATMQFLDSADLHARQELLVSVVYNGLTAFFIMCALVIGAVLPILVFHRESPLVKGLRKIRKVRGGAEPAAKQEKGKA